MKMPAITNNWKDWILGIFTIGAIGWTTTVYADIQSLKKDMGEKTTQQAVTLEKVKNIDEKIVSVENKIDILTTILQRDINKRSN